jgi:putative FmdB family regulatory protein
MTHNWHSVRASANLPGAEDHQTSPGGLHVPTYQYACTECGHGFEQFQSFSDDALTECPTCGGRLRKVFSSVGIVFKGSGFYRNDSRDAAKGKDGKSKDGKSKEKESVGAGKADSSSGGSSDTSSSKPDKGGSEKSGSATKSDSAAASASSSSGKGSGSSSGSSSSGGSSSGSSSTAGSAA